MSNSVSPLGPAQDAYSAGLSYFPDAPYLLASRVGLAGILDFVKVIPGVGNLASAGTILGNVVNLAQGGSGVDKARQDRVNYFLQQAQGGNVAAAQLILGGPDNVSGNERDMWVNAAQILSQTAQGQQTLAAARSAGSYWPVNSGDTATNYPVMRAFTAAWQSQNQPVTQAFSTLTYGANATVSTLERNPAMLLIGVAGVAAAALVLLPKRRGRR